MSQQLNAILEQYAADYAAHENQTMGEADGRSSIHYPTVFLFVGDEMEQAAKALVEINRTDWENSAGVLYLHVAAGAEADHRASGSEGEPVVSRQQSANSKPDLDGNGAAPLLASRLALSGLAEVAHNPKLGRRALSRRFYEQDTNRLELNRALRQANVLLADYGRLYASFDRVQIAIVTKVDDPLNVLVPEITVLARTIFSQSFKSVQTDLFVMISEREQAEAYGYSSAAGIAFLRELEQIQEPAYAFTAPLLVTAEGLSLPVNYGPAPLFDLVYMLSDRNERGITAMGGMQDNYHMISRILLLKNRSQLDVASGVRDAGYNNSSFKHSLVAESGRQGYVSAGIARVKRPNHSIALTVLYHFGREIGRRMQSGTDWDMREKLALFGLDPATIERRAEQMMPDEQRLLDMTGILTTGVRYDALKRMSLQEAEAALFGDSCDVFFHHQFRRAAVESLQSVRAGEELRLVLAKHMQKDPRITFYQVAEWTDESYGSGAIPDEVNARIRDLARGLDTAKAELAQLYDQRVEELQFKRLPLMDKQNLRNFIRTFIETVYTLKRQIVKTETELALLRMFAAELEPIHRRYAAQVAQMRELETRMKDAALHSIRMADDYVGQNIFDYYERVTAEVMLELEERRGSGFFFEERAVGSVTELLTQGEEALLRQLIDVCLRHILRADPFIQTFEEELLRRANVMVDYSNRQALSKEELFRILYRMLEDHAVIHIRLLDYTHEHRHEEKYLFGDGDSEFVRYALHESEAGIFKTGCVDEKRSSGVEKLNMMGGFHLEDLLYYRNGKVYYETYIQNGYELHGMDEKELPQLR